MRLLRRRLLATLPTLFAVVTVTFIIVRAAPGGPFRNEKAVPDAVRENIEARYGLDDPLAIQYLKFWRNLVTGDLGPSFQHPERPAISVLTGGALPSLVVGIAASLIAILMGLGCGTLAALHPRTSPPVSALALAALAIPVFVLGPLLIRFFALELGWLPAALWGSPRHLILPAFTLGLPVGGALTRFWRTLLAESMGSPECIAARARGLGELEVVRLHALHECFPLLLNYLAPMVATLVTGSVVVEKIFAIPGMGRYFVDSALARDYPVVIGAVLIYASALLVVHTAVDLVHSRLDPRLQREQIP